MQFIFGILPPPDLSESIQSAFPGQLAEPHITVKAQCGLTPEVDNWLPNVTQAVKGFGSFNIRVNTPSDFGDNVLYLSIDSPQIYQLHNLLMDTIRPTVDEAKNYFELADWVPHLTLSMGKGSLSESNVEKGVSLHIPIDFQVTAIWLFRQENDGETYFKYQKLSLL